MNWHGIAIIAAGALLLARPSWSAENDHATLQGKWFVESYHYNGSPVEMMQGAVREFKLDKYTLTPKSGDVYSGSIKLDETRAPRQIDLEVNGRTFKGIYELAGDTLKISYRLEGDERPMQLDSKPDSGIVLVVHKRAP
jgi:uncharacterized protein (TIGR03067 family)